MTAAGASRTGFVLAAAATVAAGVGMAVQGTANGTLGQILGSGIVGATISFISGLVIVALIAALTPSGRAGVGRAWRLVRRGEFPWWMTCGGVAGAGIVVAQSLTIPLLGVAVFTMAFVAGQLAGALGVDNTSLPPGGRKPITPWRVAGILVVLVGVSLSAIGVLAQGVAWWAPILPFVVGAMTAFQQAFNGRLRVRSESVIAPTLTNFIAGATFLLIVTTVVMVASGTRVRDFPELPAQWWTLIGGTIGVAFIGITTITVARLGVLLLSLMSLFGNLVGSLVIDLTFHSAHAEVTVMTYVAIAVVLVGVVITTLPPRRGLVAPRVQRDAAPVPTAAPGERTPTSTEPQR